MTTVGTEIEIRTRQRLFCITDMITNIGFSGSTSISSESLAEGIDLQGSDLDMMIVNKTVDVTRSVRTIKHQLQNKTVLMETDIKNPGYTRLRLLAKEDTKPTSIICKCTERNIDGLYISAKGYLNETFEHTEDTYIHGPCLSDKDQLVDMATCYRSKYLTYQATAWSFRHRNQ